MTWRCFAVTASFSLVFIASSALAHGGGLNAEGCHNNRKTGEYHCHRGPTPLPQQQRLTPNSGPSSVACGTKSTCGQMASCAEARAYLTTCGLTRLDGDGDGIPCETLCR